MVLRPRRARTLLPGGRVGARRAPCCSPRRAAAMTVPPGFQARTLPLPKASSPTYDERAAETDHARLRPRRQAVRRRAQRPRARVRLDRRPDADARPQHPRQGDGEGGPGDPRDEARPRISAPSPSSTSATPTTRRSAATTKPRPTPIYADGGDDCVETKENRATAWSAAAWCGSRLTRPPASPSAAPGRSQLRRGADQQLVPAGDQPLDRRHRVRREGALLMSGGDGASWGSLDYGQLGNFCSDPQYEGGSLRAQDVRTPATAGDPTDYNGSIIRVDRETGAAMPNNPFAVSPALRRRRSKTSRRARILAYGDCATPTASRSSRARATSTSATSARTSGRRSTTSPRRPRRDRKPVNFGWPCLRGRPRRQPRQAALAGGRKRTPQTALRSALREPVAGDRAVLRLPAPQHARLRRPPVRRRRLRPGPGLGDRRARLLRPEPASPVEAVFSAEYDGRPVLLRRRPRLHLDDAARAPDGAPDPATVANFSVREGPKSFTPVDIVQGAGRGALRAELLRRQHRRRSATSPATRRRTAQLERRTRLRADCR